MKDLDLPMLSTAPFIPNDMSLCAGDAPADLDCTLNFMAVLRLLRPNSLIPTTSALEILSKDGQLRGLMAGANAITVHDGTPAGKSADFVLYRKDRYEPKEELLSVVEKAGLVCSSRPLL